MILTEYVKNRGNIDVDPQALDELLGIKPPRRRKPQCGEIYWFIADCGVVNSAYWAGGCVDEYRFKIGNVFFSEADAEFELERREVIAKLENYAEEHNEYKVSWNAGEQSKWFIGYNHDHDEFNTSCNFSNEILKTVYFTSEKIALAAIESVGADRIKKYVCRVVE